MAHWPSVSGNLEVKKVHLSIWRQHYFDPVEKLKHLKSQILLNFLFKTHYYYFKLKAKKNRPLLCV